MEIKIGDKVLDISNDDGVEGVVVDIIEPNDLDPAGIIEYQITNCGFSSYLCNGDLERTPFENWQDYLEIL